MLSNVDRELIERCLNRTSSGWEDFVSRYLGLVIHVVQHTAQSRSIPISESLRDDLVSDVFFALLKNDFAVLRSFRGQSSLATYLTVVARRVVVRGLLRKRNVARREAASIPGDLNRTATHPELGGTENREALELALGKLSQQEAAAVRMFHFEGRTYREIGAQIGVAENSVGPYLSRARAKLRDSLSN